MNVRKEIIKIKEETKQKQNNFKSLSDIKDWFFFLRNTIYTLLGQLIKKVEKIQMNKITCDKEDATMMSAIQRIMRNY